ncbi:MAG: glucose-6-phosphate dehydrogenase [Acidimicrobiales bacterium]
MSKSYNYTLSKPDPHILVIFGASGDLSRKKLMPALAMLAARGALPEKFSIVGVALDHLQDSEFIELALQSVPDPSPAWKNAVNNFRYIKGDYGDPETFHRLSTLLEEIDSANGTAGNRIYYLATIPSLFAVVAESLKAAGCISSPGANAFTRMVVEKPFGSNLESAVELNRNLHACFDETQIFRIDHYLGKETVQNLLALRFANAIFEPVWNRRYIASVQVTVAESIGIEHRGAYYDKTGALRDIVQNHVMQVVALTLMEPPTAVSAQDVRDEKVKLLKSVEIVNPEHAARRVVRGQYGSGVAAHQSVLAYREEDDVPEDSDTETYVAMELIVDNWRWAGMPIYVRTGKRLPDRVTEVALEFKDVPHLAFKSRQARLLETNRLVMRIQPDEGISLRFGAKAPGESFDLRSVSMNFSYEDTFKQEPPDAYERLIHDAMIGDHMLFLRSDEVEQAWKIVDPFLDAFINGDVPVSMYRSGSWGPHEADILLARKGHAWSNP